MFIKLMFYVYKPGTNLWYTVRYIHKDK